MITSRHGITRNSSCDQPAETVGQRSAFSGVNIVIDTLDEFSGFYYFSCGSTSADYISNAPSAAA